MENNMKLRKILTFMFTAVLAFGMTGISAFAAENENPGKDSIQIAAEGDKAQEEESNTDKDLIPEQIPGAPAFNINSLGSILADSENKEDTEEADTEEKTDKTSDDITETEEKDTEKKETQKTEVKSVKKTAKTAEKKTVKAKYSAAELKYLSSIIYCEAGSEPYAGKLAVGIVVVNRKESKKFPNTIKDVIYQKYQFGPARNGSLAKALTRYEAGRFTSNDQKECIKAAKAALEGTKEIIYKGKTRDLKGYYYFSGRVSGYRLQIANHQFK